MKPDGKAEFQMAGLPSTKAKQRLWVEGVLARLDAVREDLLILYARLDAVREDLLILYRELHNRRPVTRAPRAASTLTPAKRAAVRKTHSAHPHLTQQQIANRHDLNIGRVSETLAGKRT